MTAPAPAPLYNAHKTFALLERCDGKLHAFTPDIYADYAGDGAWDAPRDHGIPPYHLSSSIVSKSTFRCSACGAEWEDTLRGLLAQTYNREGYDRTFTQSPLAWKKRQETP